MKGFFILTLLLTVFNSFANVNCKKIILNDNFSDKNNWKTEGSGVTVNNGTCIFNNVNNGAINRVFQSLNYTLSNDYWKAKCKFSLLAANPSGHGTTETIMVLTEGTLDYYSANNGIGVFLTSGPNSPTDNNINNWQFVIQGKNLGSYSTLSTGIYLNDQTKDYYIQLERLSSGITQLSIFKDSLYSTELIGSPVSFNIDPSISGLNTVQHASCSIGSSTRMISNASIDNVVICEELIESTCNDIVLNDNFSVPSNWKTEGKTVTIHDGICEFNDVYNGTINRIYQSLNPTLSDNYWKAKCKFSLLAANPSGHGTTETIMVLTEGTLDYYSANNGIGVFLTSGPNSPTDNNINNWQFVIQGKNLGSYSTLSTGIYLNNQTKDYYIQLERLSSSIAQLSIFKDSLYSIELIGSPVSFNIDPSISGLNTVQHASCSIGSSTRMISNASVDNLIICQETKASINNITKNTLNYIVYPNPTINQCVIETSQFLKIIIKNIAGETIKKQEVNEGKTIIDLSNFANGLYLIELDNGISNEVVKIIKE